MAGHPAVVVAPEGATKCVPIPNAGGGNCAKLTMGHALGHINLAETQSQREVLDVGLRLADGMVKLVTRGRFMSLQQLVMARGDERSITEDEYRSYYEAGYKTDVDRVEIKDDRVTFHRGDKAVSGTYADDGHEVLTYPKGNRGVRYVFRKTEGDAEAPAVIQFSDHRIAPEKSGHFHLYWGDDRAALLSEVTHWPTYYPAALTGAEIARDMMAH